MDEKLIPFKVTLPGVILKEEIEANEWTTEHFARKSGVSETVLEKIISGHEAITPELSAQLAQAFGLSDDFWYKLQARYDAHRAARAAAIN